MQLQCLSVDLNDHLHESEATLDGDQLSIDGESWRVEWQEDDAIDESTCVVRSLIGPFDPGTEEEQGLLVRGFARGSDDLWDVIIVAGEGELELRLSNGVPITISIDEGSGLDVWFDAQDEGFPEEVETPLPELDEEE